MRRIVVVATAFAVLIAAVSAYAATGGLNDYSGSNLKFAPNKAGSAKKPSAISFTENYKANGTNGNRTAPLSDITTKLYGVVTNPKPFPTCSQAKIAAAKSDASCPKGALIATGAITAIVGPTASQANGAPGSASCDPLLHAWNGGPGKVVFFFVDQDTAHQCYNGVITTGSVGPFVGKVKTVGKTLVMDTPIPASVSFPVSGLEGSLTSETLHFTNKTTKVHGKTVNLLQSVGCKNGKRPYSVTFTASEPGGAPQSDTVSGTQKCS